MRTIGVLLMMILVVTGCGRKPKSAEPPDPAQILQEKLQAVRDSVMEQDRIGNTNGVISLMEAAVHNPELADARDGLMAQLIQFELNSGHTTQVRARILAEMSNSPEKMVPFAIRLSDYYAGHQQLEEARAWMLELTKRDLPEDAALGVHHRLALLHLQAEDLDALFAQLDAMVQQFDISARQTMQAVRDYTIGKRDLETTDRLFEELESTSAERPWLQVYIETGELDLMGRRREWVSAETQFKDMAARFDVDALDAPFAVLLSRASNGRQAELVERLCEFVLSEHRDKATIVARAASFWVIGSSERSQWPQVIERLNTLLDQGVPEGVLLNPFSKTIYAVVQSGAPESQQAMLDVGKRISKGELTEADQIRIKILMFDGAFLMDDYDAVLTALLEGVPERDEDWHEMAINKVSAHKALKEGNIDEAIKRFREFMEVTDRTWKDAQVDPSTRIRHSREMIMGFNARRIGNILKEAGRAEEAGKAYREAVDYYEAALEQAEPDSPEHRKIVSDLGEIPADSSTSIE